MRTSQKQTVSAGEVIAGVAIGIVAIAVIDAIVNHPQDVVDALVKITPCPPQSYLPPQENQCSGPQNSQWSYLSAFQVAATPQPATSFAKPVFRQHTPRRRRIHTNRSTTLALPSAPEQVLTSPTPVAKKASDMLAVTQPAKHEQVLMLFYRHLDETGKRPNAGLSYTKEFTAFIQPVRKVLAEEQRRVNTQVSPRRSAGRPPGAIDSFTARILNLKREGRTSEEISALTYEGHSLNSKAGKSHKAKVDRLLKYHSQKSAGRSTAGKDGASSSHLELDGVNNN